MLLSDIYTNILKKKIFLGLLQQGIIPDQYQVDQLFEKAITNNSNLDKPLTSKKQYTINPFAPASASKFNESISNLLLDLQVLYQAAVENAKNTTDFTDRVMTQLQSLEKQAHLLDAKANNLLLISSDVEGYLDFVFDNFISKEKISLAETTVDINNQLQIVQLPVLTSNRVSTKDLTSDSFTFKVLTTDYFVADSIVPGCPIINAFKDADRFWVQKIRYLKAPIETVTSLVVNFKQSVAVSNIIIKPVSTSKGSLVNVGISYSNDNVNWTTVDGEAAKYLTGDTSLVFTLTEATYWKFIFTKTGYDTFVGSYYDFYIGAKAIEFYNKGYATDQLTSEAVLYSTPLSSTTTTAFNKVSLKACEYVPQNTSIDYSIALLTAAVVGSITAGTMSVDELTFTPVDPVNRITKVNPTVVDGGQLTYMSGYDLATIECSSAPALYQDNSTNQLLSTSINTSSVDFIPANYNIWRNVGENTVGTIVSTTIHRARQVNNIDIGWISDGDFYSCEFLITEPNGRLIDFGSSPVEIDGLVTTGHVTLTQGLHKIRTGRKNWYSYQLNSAALPTVTTSSPDILYPHNHKYLIEGIGSAIYGIVTSTLVTASVTLGEVLDAQNVYIPSTAYWAKTLERKTISDFILNTADDNYGCFAFYTETADYPYYIMVKQGPTLFEDEKFAIITKDLGNGELYSAAVLKAVLRTNDQHTTPILQSYFIRLGF